MWQIGGVRAPSPVGELGNVEMTQALTLCDTQWEPSGSDLLLQGQLCLLIEWLQGQILSSTAPAFAKQALIVQRPFSQGPPA